MIQFVQDGGPLFMIPLLIALITIIILTIRGFLKENSDTNRALIASLSLFALVYGILGTTVGLIGAFDAISIATGISHQMLALGLRIGLFPTAFGLSVFVVGRIGIITLLLRKK